MRGPEITVTSLAPHPRPLSPEYRGEGAEVRGQRSEVTPLPEYRGEGSQELGEPGIQVLRFAPFFAPCEFGHWNFRMDAPIIER